VAFAFDGATPPPALVRRIRRGEAGAVVLFARNVPSRAALRRLTARLQAIPRPAKLDAPLLVMVDQEGGPVRRIPGPPARSAPELGAAGPRATRAAGRAAGRLLAGLGVNVDLAPVSDVGRPRAALTDEGRTFPGGAAAVARSAVAFAAGLRDAGVAATAKHFPGFGAAVVNTDDAPVTIATPLATLRAVDMRPFRAMIAHRVPLVMVSTAVYPAIDRRPAALSRRVVTGELRNRLGFRGVVVTDALDTPALAPIGGTGQVAIRSARAGADLLIFAGTYAEGERAATGLATAFRAGALAREPAEAAVGRLMALRSGLASVRPPG
jgi:beta-N-acetylhexosaminidase